MGETCCTPFGKMVFPGVRGGPHTRRRCAGHPASSMEGFGWRGTQAEACGYRESLGEMRWTKFEGGGPRWLGKVSYYWMGPDPGMTI